MTRVDQVTVFTLDFAFIFVKLSEVKPAVNDCDFDFQFYYMENQLPQKCESASYARQTYEVSKNTQGTNDSLVKKTNRP